MRANHPTHAQILLQKTKISLFRILLQGQTINVNYKKRGE